MERALKLLRQQRWRVVSTEVTQRAVLEVDGDHVPYLVRADAVVERKGRRYVAEFKHGAEASRPETRAARRQLLEYALLFGVDGVVLVDAHAGRIALVRFPGLRHSHRRRTAIVQRLLARQEPGTKR